MGRPEGYPLPWCDAVDRPYWVLNMALIRSREGWREFQARKPMAELIPHIDDLIQGTQENTHDRD